MMSMIEDSLQRDEGRELVLFYGARCSAEHLFQDRLAELSRQHANFQVVTCYSRPAPEDVLGLDYHVLGRVSLDLIQKTLPSPKVRFYLCGPGAFTGQLHQQLRQWGAAAEAIRFEAFGPASVHSDKSCWSERPVEQTDAGRVAVRFARSQRTGEWTTVQGSLLETGLSMGIPMSFGCRAGQCGECQIRLLQGQVHYPNGRPANLEDGYCLPCIAAPLPRATTADIDQVVLDA
jgi:Na+-transporting NADH:ubiquinone oxidoreductase subunit NqrF